MQGKGRRTAWITELRIMVALYCLLRLVFLGLCSSYPSIHPSSHPPIYPSSHHPSILPSTQLIILPSSTYPSSIHHHNPSIYTLFPPSLPSFHSPTNPSTISPPSSLLPFLPSFFPYIHLTPSSNGPCHLGQVIELHLGKMTCCRAQMGERMKDAL